MSSSERLRLQVSPWLALLLGAFVLLSSPALLAALLTAALVHELAHWAVLRRLGGEVRSLQLGLFGARMEIAHPERLSYGGEMLVTAAGPLVNLLLAPGPAWLGREAEVLLEEIKELDGVEYLLGHTRDYVKVAVPLAENGEKAVTNTVVRGTVEGFVNDEILLLSPLEFSK